MIIGALSSLLACQPPVEEKQEEGEALAKVYNQTLYLEDLEGMIPIGSTTEDSTLYLNSLVESWVREKLLLHEAELNIPSNVNIDQLVRDYRSTLILHNYEQQLIENELDSTITQAEIQAFYDQNKDQYQIKNPILRCKFLKVQNSAPNVDKVPLWWESSEEEDALLLVSYCDKNAEAYFLDENKWHDIEKIAKFMPNNMLTNYSVTVQKNYKHQDQDFLYLLKIYEVVSNNQPLPLGYIENRAKKVILHQRKIKLIEDRKENLYERSLKGENVKIYK